MDVTERLTTEELRDLTEKAKELDRQSEETDRRVERLLLDLDRIAKRIRESA